MKCLAFFFCIRFTIFFYKCWIITIINITHTSNIFVIFIFRRNGNFLSPADDGLGNFLLTKSSETGLFPAAHGRENPRPREKMKLSRRFWEAKSFPTGVRAVLVTVSVGEKIAAYFSGRWGQINKTNATHVLKSHKNCHWDVVSQGILSFDIKLSEILRVSQRPPWHEQSRGKSLLWWSRQQ